MKDGRPAFPTTYHHMNCGVPETMYADGMTLRDYFAGQALTGLLSDADYQPANYNETAAGFAYKMADAMMKAANDVR